MTSQPKTPRQRTNTDKQDFKENNAPANTSTNDTKDTKDTKDSKDTKETKDAKETKDTKDSKTTSNEASTKQKKESNNFGPNANKNTATKEKSAKTDDKDDSKDKEKEKEDKPKDVSKQNDVNKSLKDYILELESAEDKNRQNELIKEILKKSKLLPKTAIENREIFIGNQEIVTRKDIDSMDQAYKQNGTLLIPGAELNRFLRYFRAIQNDDILNTSNVSTGSTYASLASIYGFPGAQSENVQTKNNWTSTIKKYRDTNDAWSIQHNESFLQWNRLYLTTLERALQEAAAKDTDEKRYKYETKSMGPICLPFWDFTKMIKSEEEKDVNGLPAACLAAQVKIDDKVVDNPLYNFKFVTPVQFNGKSLSNAGGSVRNDDNAYKTLVRDNKTLFKIHRAMNEPFHHLFAGERQNTLHSALNDIHNAIGGFMADSQWCAWDPLFWLFHCNLDRLLESWYQKWFKGNVRNGVINNIETYSKDHFILQQELGPFYGDFNNPLVDRHLIHSYLTFREVIQDSEKYQMKYVTLFEFDKHFLFQQYCLESSYLTAFVVEVYGLSYRLPVNINVYVLPISTKTSSEVSIDKKYLVGVISLTGGESFGSKNGVSNSRDNFSRTIDATRVMYGNGLTRVAKVFLQATTPGPDSQPLNLDELGITAHLRSLC